MTAETSAGGRTFLDGPCARNCGGRGFYLYSGPDRDQPEQMVCIPCYKAEEFRPGHHLTGDRVHFLGTCDDCAARQVMSMSLAQVESWYRFGSVSQDVYEAYCHVWATSAYRYSVGASWRKSPVIPEVVRLVAVMRGIAALRVTVRGAL